MRREQSNFQLVVITHDHAFVKLLGGAGVTDHFYDVYKDERSNIKHVVLMSHVAPFSKVIHNHGFLFALSPQYSSHSTIKQKSIQELR